MAIETAVDRFSMMGFGDPVQEFMHPFGSVGAGPRANLLGLYGGLPLTLYFGGYTKRTTIVVLDAKNTLEI